MSDYEIIDKLNIGLELQHVKGIPHCEKLGELQTEKRPHHNDKYLQMFEDFDPPTGTMNFEPGP